MKTNHVLVDYENVKVEDIAPLNLPQVRLSIFIGANQTKLSSGLVMALQQFETRGRFIQCASNGPNTLDFHIAFCCGEIVAQEPDAFLHIISRDTGFDPLISHLKSRRILASRVGCLEELPFLKIAQARQPNERLDLIVSHFKKKGTTKPRTLKTLANSISTIFLKSLTDEEVAELVDELQKRKFVRLNGSKLEYSLA